MLFTLFVLQHLCGCCVVTLISNSHSGVVTSVSHQAVRVQDPPDGLPAAATSSLQLQEPRKSHPLERPEQRRREREDRVYCEKGGGQLFVTKLFGWPLPSLKTVLFLFSLGQMGGKSMNVFE